MHERYDTAGTWIYPLIQMGPFNINVESEAMHRLLQCTEVNDRLYISTAYFNPSTEYIDLITNQSESDYHVLASSPEVISLFIPFIVYPKRNSCADELDLMNTTLLG